MSLTDSIELVNYEYPTSGELRLINPEKIVELTRTRPTFEIFPITESDLWTLEWEQKDNWRGFQQLRGLDGEPSYVKMVGAKRFSAEPGVYGEYMTINETMMTLRARAGRPDEPVNIDELVLERQDYLNAREIDLIEYIHWRALLDGTFTFYGKTGAIYSDTFPIQQVDFSDWTDLANGTPLKDLLGLKLHTNGKSISFASNARIYMNSATLTYLLMNKNDDDLGGQLAIVVNGVKPFKTLAEINTLLLNNNLPQIVEYNEGYFAEETGTFTNWIPDLMLSIVGARTNGDRLGEYRMVRNAQNPGQAPGRYEAVIDWLDKRIPRMIEVHRGHNGGLVIFYGSAILRATCGS